MNIQSLNLNLRLNVIFAANSPLLLLKKKKKKRKKERKMHESKFRFGKYTGQWAR